MARSRVHCTNFRTGLRIFLSSSELHRELLNKHVRTPADIALVYNLKV
jgi:hypothetical protein